MIKTNLQIPFSFYLRRSYGSTLLDQLDQSGRASPEDTAHLAGSGQRLELWTHVVINWRRWRIIILPSYPVSWGSSKQQQQLINILYVYLCISRE